MCKMHCLLRTNIVIAYKKNQLLQQLILTILYPSPF